MTLSGTRFVIGLALLALPLTACSAKGDDDRGAITPTGSGNERRFAVSDFDSVGLSSGADVDVRVGSDYSVVATGSPEALDKLRIRKDGKGLDLGQRSGIHWSSGDKVRIAVTMPRISGAAIGGSGSITIDKVQGDNFEGSIGGSGKLTVHAMDVGSADWNIGGSGDIFADGRARSTQVSIGGSGKVRNEGLRTDTAELTIAGAGNIAANAARTAKVTIVGAGDVTVTGGAKCSITKMGAGNVRCG